MKMKSLKLEKLNLNQKKMNQKKMKQRKMKQGKMKQRKMNLANLIKLSPRKPVPKKELNFFSSKNILYFTEEDLKKLPASSSGSKKVEKKARKIKVDQKLKLPDINEREAGSRAPRVFSPISFVRNTQGLFEKHQVFKSHQNIFIIQQKSLDLKCK